MVTRHLWHHTEQEERHIGSDHPQQHRVPALLSRTSSSLSVGLMITRRWHFGLLLFWLRPFHHKRLLAKKIPKKHGNAVCFFFTQVIREHIHQHHTFTVSNGWIRPMWEQWSLDSDSTTLVTLTNWTSKSAITTGYSRSLAPIVYLSLKCSRAPFHLLLINMQRVGER